MNQSTTRTMSYRACISCVACFSLLSNTLHANSTENTVSGQLRLGYVYLDNLVGKSTNTLSFGGKLGYKTKSYKGISAGATFYTTNPLAGIGSEALFLSSKKEAYSILGEAYLNVVHGSTHIKLGRQELESPFANTDDIGMIPNTFEGIQLTNTTLQNTTIIAAHLRRWSGVDTDIPENFTQMNNNKGVNILGMVYEKSTQWNLQGWYYSTAEATNIGYVEGAINPSESLRLGAQYSAQNGGGFDGNVWGLSAQYDMKDVTLSLAHNKVSSGSVTNGFGGGPFFTSSEDHTIAEVENQQATALGIEYSGIKNLTLAARNVGLDKGENELDLTASYELSNRLTADILYHDMHKDGEMVRMFMNYSF